jgi:hypothetical protein
MSVVRGTVINIHHHGATVRLDDGTLAAVPAAELALHRSAYEESLAARIPLELILDSSRRHATVVLEGAAAAPPAQTPPPAAPQIVDAAFETQINAYLKSTEAWAPPDRPPPAERHFIRKKRREAIFEARKQAT